MYQLREGGEDTHGASEELLRNVWTDSDTPPLHTDPAKDHVVEPPALSPCEGIVCINNGSCVVEDGYARCDCPLGYSGSYCERGGWDWGRSIRQSVLVMLCKTESKLAACLVAVVAFFHHLQGFWENVQPFITHLRFFFFSSLFLKWRLACTH